MSTEPRADVLMQILDSRLALAVFVGVALVPASVWGHKECVTVGRFFFEESVDFFCGQVFELFSLFLALFVKDVGHALEEEHAKDVLFVLGGIHRAAQDVGGFH